MLFKYGKIAAKVAQFGVGIAGMILFFVVLAKAKIKEGEYNEGLIGAFISCAEYAMYACIALIILFVIVNIVSNIINSPKKLLGVGLTLALLVVVMLISYNISAPEFDMTGKTPEAVEEFSKIPKSAFQWSEASIYAMYILLGLAVASIVITEIIRRFK